MKIQTTILLADDHPLFRAGLRDTIERNTAFIVVGEAGDGQEAWRLIGEKRPAVAILDIEMPKMNGLEVALRVYEENLPVSVIILTMYEEYAFFNRAVDAGVKGYILKETAVPDVLQGIAKVVAGEYYFSPSLAGRFMQRDALNHPHHPAGGYESLTPTEREVLGLISESLSSRQIAERLSVSIRTIDTHRRNICGKLGLSGSYALLRYALTRQGKV